MPPVGDNDHYKGDKASKGPQEEARRASDRAGRELGAGKASERTRRPSKVAGRASEAAGGAQGG